MKNFRNSVFDAKNALLLQCNNEKLIKWKELDIISSAGEKRGQK